MFNQPMCWHNAHTILCCNRCSTFYESRKINNKTWEYYSGESESGWRHPPIRGQLCGWIFKTHQSPGWYLHAAWKHRAANVAWAISQKICLQSAMSTGITNFLDLSKSYPPRSDADSRPVQRLRRCTGLEAASDWIFADAGISVTANQPRRGRVNDSFQRRLLPNWSRLLGEYLKFHVGKSSLLQIRPKWS